MNEGSRMNEQVKSNKWTNEVECMKKWSLMKKRKRSPFLYLTIHSCWRWIALNIDEICSNSHALAFQSLCLFFAKLIDSSMFSFISFILFSSKLLFRYSFVLFSFFSIYRNWAWTNHNYFINFARILFRIDQINNFPFVN